MKTRSKSVPRLFHKEIIFLAPSKVQDLHEKISCRVYGEKYTRSSLKLVFNAETHQDTINPVHEHIKKRFEKKSQSSPNKRIKMLKEARLYKGKNSLAVNFSKQSLISLKEIPLSRHEKSTELFQKASKLLKKEKENTNNLARKSRDYSGEVQMRIQNLHKKFQSVKKPYKFPLKYLISHA